MEDLVILSFSGTYVDISGFLQAGPAQLHSYIPHTSASMKKQPARNNQARTPPSAGGRENSCSWDCPTTPVVLRDKGDVSVSWTDVRGRFGSSIALEVAMVPGDIRRK